MKRSAVLQSSASIKSSVSMKNIACIGRSRSDNSIGSSGSRNDTRSSSGRGDVTVRKTDLAPYAEKSGKDTGKVGIQIEQKPWTAVKDGKNIILIVYIKRC